MLRGLVVVLMALDHVRDFFLAGTDLDPTANPGAGVALFFTRWITHLCAPVFVLLAGVSAGLMAGRRSRTDLARFLALRGLWLVCIEVFVISSALTFSPAGLPQFGGQTLVIMQVIWAIGGSMIVLAAAQRLGRRLCFFLGGAIVVLHNLLDRIWPATQLFDPAPLWTALHSQMSIDLGPMRFAFSYPVLPWVGVMLLGFGLSSLFELPPRKRDSVLLKSGVGMTLLFFALRAMDVYGDPNPWQRQADGLVATLIDFLNTTKYPPSLQYLLMTLGPAAVLCFVGDRLSGWWKDALVKFGRVPFAFYISHVLLIHLVSVLLGLYQGFRLQDMLTIFLFYPKGYGLGLAGVYVTWSLVIALLYPLCSWFAGVKARRKDWWLSYL